jgi:hypothetical protein
MSETRWLPTVATGVGLDVGYVCSVTVFQCYSVSVRSISVHNQNKDLHLVQLATVAILEGGSITNTVIWLVVACIKQVKC